MRTHEGLAAVTTHRRRPAPPPSPLLAPGRGPLCHENAPRRAAGRTRAAPRPAAPRLCSQVSGEEAKKGGARKAAHAAYAEHLEPFHNWLLKNTFNVALNAIPTRREFFQRLGPHLAEPKREQVVSQELREYAEVVKHITEALRALFSELDLEDTRKV